MKLLGDKVAIVTGAASGIGRASALELASQGSAVIMADLDLPGAEDTVALAGENKARVLAVKADVTSDREMAALVALAASTFGGLHIAVNVAGGGDRSGPLAELDEDDFDHMIGLNLKSVFLAMRHQLAQMAGQGVGGSIINISSTAGLRGVKNSSLYSAAKHGVLGFTKCAALDYADDQIRVNAICPGAIATPQFERVLQNRFPGAAKADALQKIGKDYPLGRIGAPSDIANLVAWLASDLADYITGQAFAVDGGRTA